ncbi:hypothetical protein ANO11243_018770 [Dothideomycetidae sp. 11243]|nr:hypothetical protein ANO11243_018770 [fungal sp. No.11243]
MEDETAIGTAQSRSAQPFQRLRSSSGEYFHFQAAYGLGVFASGASVNKAFSFSLTLCCVEVCAQPYRLYTILFTTMKYEYDSLYAYDRHAQVEQDITNAVMVRRRGRLVSGNGPAPQGLVRRREEEAVLADRGMFRTEMNKKTTRALQKHCVTYRREQESLKQDMQPHQIFSSERASELLKATLTREWTAVRCMNLDGTPLAAIARRSEGLWCGRDVDVVTDVETGDRTAATEVYVRRHKALHWFVAHSWNGEDGGCGACDRRCPRKIEVHDPTDIVPCSTQNAVGDIRWRTECRDLIHSNSRSGLRTAVPVGNTEDRVELSLSSSVK